MSNFFIPKLHLPHFYPSVNIINNKRIEIYRFYKIHSTKGIIFSIILHLFIFSSYYIIKTIKGIDSEEKIVKVRILKYSDLGPPPSLTQTTSAPNLRISSSLKPSIGIPIPVPDAEVNPENTIATQTELSSVQNTNITNENNLAGGDIVIEDEIDEPGMNEFVPVENPPQIIHAEQPEYPDIARRAGVEGFVWVKILIGKDGKPLKAITMPGASNQMFEEAAIKAAMKYNFTPATMSHGPVKVWVAIKFKFQLTTNKKK